MFTLADINSLHTLPINIRKGDRIFLFWDLGAGKTTLVRHLLGNLDIPGTIKSPTYVYYHQYEHVFHFDLYRISDYEEFVNIGAEEIFDDPENIILVEWPEILGSRYTPTLSIRIRKIPGREDVREFEIEDLRTLD